MDGGTQPVLSSEALTSPHQGPDCGEIHPHSWFQLSMRGSENKRGKPVLGSLCIMLVPLFYIVWN